MIKSQEEEASLELHGEALVFSQPVSSSPSGLMGLKGGADLSPEPESGFWRGSPHRSQARGQCQPPRGMPSQWEGRTRRKTTASQPVKPECAED